MASILKQQIQGDMKNALRAQDKQRLGVMRLVLAAIKQVEVDERIDADDTCIIQILNKMIKQRRDSIAQYDEAKRSDLADQERLEVQIIQAYLPEPLSEAEVDRMLSEVIAEVGATSVKDMGKVMAELKARSQGRADMAQISAKIKARLA